jgi:DNA repair ATPase RecN
MNKKTARISSRVVADDDEPQVSQRMLHSIQQKLERSAALNGGFDKLLYKIDTIEQSQNVISEKVDKIHDAIYDPDEGLFARITNNKVDQNESISGVEKKVVEISAWKEQKQKDIEEIGDIKEKIHDKINSIENKIETLNTFKLMTVGVAKWMLAAAGGGVATILFKVLYDFIIIK